MWSNTPHFGPQLFELLKLDVALQSSALYQLRPTIRGQKEGPSAGARYTLQAASGIKAERASPSLTLAPSFTCYDTLLIDCTPPDEGERWRAWL